ncbi:uncharacterized protein LOC134345510 isoform X8 [Mobula hypostoma]|uniref:uncharacterized protein LOC134345510 isoform X8 n=1 Tax=Mobula hypostoma TaxID=723540 RepID=UPI002FC2FAA9
MRMMKQWSWWHGLKYLRWPRAGALSRLRGPRSHRVGSRHFATRPGTVRVGCASGFWGDTAISVPQLVYGGNLDFLVFDYLSEITMSLLTAAKAKSPNLGYVPDFVQTAMAPFIKDIHKRGIRVVCNAGGVNPLACAAALQKVVEKAQLDMKIAVVTGDDLMLMKDMLKEVGVTDMYCGSPFPESVQSMNAYLGAQPIGRALDLGADVVVTGRCVDSALVLGPLIHYVLDSPKVNWQTGPWNLPWNNRLLYLFPEGNNVKRFGWKKNEFDLLAAGSLAGHLIECGAQCTGGIFTDWHRVPDWDNIGFPVLECSSDGSFTLSKPPKTGGLVSFGTVSEQLVYEIGDPRHYQLPDVVCNFSHVTISEISGIEGGAVHVQGAKGLPPSDSYKICATYLDGYRTTAVCPVGGCQSVKKGRRTAESILKRVRRMFKEVGLVDFKSVNVQILGSEETYGDQTASRTYSPREAVIWLAVHHMEKKALELFSREIASAGSGMDLPTGPCSYRLEELAYTRSGDKGNTANIGVIARHPLYYPYLRKAVTAKAVEEYFQHLIQKEDSDTMMVTRRYVREIFSDVNAKEFKAVRPLSRRSTDVNRGESDSIPPVIHNQLLCFCDIEGDIVFLTPLCQGDDFLSVGCLIII